jgi:hypothetical protein
MTAYTILTKPTPLLFPYIIRNSYHNTANIFVDFLGQCKAIWGKQGKCKRLPAMCKPLHLLGFCPPPVHHLPLVFPCSSYHARTPATDVYQLHYHHPLSQCSASYELSSPCIVARDFFFPFPSMCTFYALDVCDRSIRVLIDVIRLCESMSAMQGKATIECGEVRGRMDTRMCNDTTR